MNNYLLPRLKPFVEFYPAENRIYFFNCPGIAIEMDDSSGFIAEVCRLMDGKKSLEQLTQSLEFSFPKEIPYLGDLLAALDGALLLEDTFDNVPDGLSEYDITRWARNLEFFGAHCKAKENKYSHQAQLKSIKVALLGLGGVGSHVLYDLAALGVQNIRGVDFDKIELSNLNRQILYNESDIGLLKTEVAKNRILQFLPQANIEFFNKKISSVEDIEFIISGQDIVISVLDQPREKIIDWLNEACTKQNIPFICGAFDSKCAIYYSVVPGKTGCIECWKTSAKRSGSLFQEIIQRKGFVSSSSLNVAISPLISVLTGLILTEFLKLTTKIGEPQSLGRLCSFDFANAKISVAESWERIPLCSMCGSLSTSDVTL